MSIPSHPSVQDATSRFSERKAVILLLDITGTTKIVTALAPLHFAAFLDEFYKLCARQVERAGGEVVEYPGDAALAMFDEGCKRSHNTTCKLSSYGMLTRFTLLAIGGLNGHRCG